MYLSKTDKELISSLKGRISKVLSISSQLEVTVRTSLEDLYAILDEVILWNKKMTKRKSNSFKKRIKEVTEVFNHTSKKYVKEHIMPLVNKIVDKEWEAGTNE